MSLGTRLTQPIKRRTLLSCWQAIRAAAAALAAGGRGGTLLFPAGRTYLTGAFNLSSNSVLKLEVQ